MIDMTLNEWLEFNDKCMRDALNHFGIRIRKQNGQEFVTVLESKEIDRETATRFFGDLEIVDVIPTIYRENTILHIIVKYDVTKK